MLAISEVLTQLCRLFHVPEAQPLTICQNIKKTRLTLKVVGRKPLAAARDEEELYWSEQPRDYCSKHGRGNGGRGTKTGREGGGGGCVRH